MTMSHRALGTQALMTAISTTEALMSLIVGADKAHIRAPIQRIIRASLSSMMTLMTSTVSLMRRAPPPTSEGGGLVKTALSRARVSKRLRLTERGEALRPSA
jgi:hypothetical protein